jgi:hypothetical protein
VERYPDILDRLGKPPRELGGVQVHAEARALEGRAWLTWWIQAAFEPAGSWVLQVRMLEIAPPQLEVKLPALDGGRVVRGCEMLPVPPGIHELVLTAHGALPEAAERCRDSWAGERALLRVAVTPGSAPAELGLGVVWRPGMPVPEPRSLVPAPVKTPAAPRSGMRECRGCGFAGRQVDFAGDRFCPRCGAGWE